MTENFVSAPDGLVLLVCLNLLPYLILVLFSVIQFKPVSKIDNLEMPFGITQTNGEVEPPGTEFLIDDQLATQTVEHSRMKHGTGKVCVF
jgi:hypothetical protein